MVDLKKYPKPKKGLFDDSYFVPNEKYLFSPSIAHIVNKIKYIFWLAPIFSLFYFDREVAILLEPIVLYFTYRFYKRNQLHQKQLEYMRTGHIPPHTPRGYANPSAWDEKEQRRRYHSEDYQ